MVNPGSEGEIATVTVRGEAAIRARPDGATLSITLSKLEESPSKAMAAVEERSTALSALLDRLHIVKADRSTTGVAVHEEVDHTPSGQRLLGHRAIANVTVRLTDPVVIGRAISLATEELQASVHGPQWYVSATNPVRLEAAQQAAAAARQKAQAYATGVDARLGPLIRLVEPDAVASAPGAVRATFAGAMRGMPIEPGEHDVRATIEATFALEPAG